MDSSLANLAVVVCHGSYSTPVLYEPLVHALNARGIEAYFPQRPSSDLSKLNVGDVNNPDFDREPPEGGYPTEADDAEVIIELLKKLIDDEGKWVLLVGHSSGGWVATESAKPELQAATRKSEGKEGGIIGIFYMGAFIIPVGESVHSFFQPKDGPVVVPPFMTFHKHGPAGLGTITDGPRYLFNDLDEESAKKWSATLTAGAVMPVRLTNDAYATVPCAYLVLEKDQTLPKEYQESMVAMQNQKGTPPFTIYYAPSGHSPHLSWTDGLVGKLEEFARKVLPSQ
ncbi:hypothetical protein DTO271G3_6232 [Paecilomyces variotii]|nr:hypothetical protein DTO271G3_6232 [Paecilomyces variotii]